MSVLIILILGVLTSTISRILVSKFERVYVRSLSVRKESAAVIQDDISLMSLSEVKRAPGRDLFCSYSPHPRSFEITPSGFLAIFI